MSISIQQLTYRHSDGEVLFEPMNFTVNHGQKAGLTGDNGSGKSTLLQIIGGQREASGGLVTLSAPVYYVPQHFGQYDHLSIAGALRIDRKINALHGILQGNASEELFADLSDDWNIEKKASAALHAWGLKGIDLFHPMQRLSGGEKTKVFLAGMDIHSPQIILMDEPSNHMDTAGRNKLYACIRSGGASMLIVSHDRHLLNLLPGIYELSKGEIKFYNGNFESYKSQKELETKALYARLDEKEKELRMARKTAREAIERKQKHEVRGEKSNIKKGIGKMAMHTLKDKAEKSSSKLQSTHTEKTESIASDLAGIRKTLPQVKIMKVDFNDPSLHTGKILVSAQGINYRFGTRSLWREPLGFQIRSGERICIEGLNGSGKTTLLKLISGFLMPSVGELKVFGFKCIYLDQEYSIINNRLSVLEQLEQFNETLEEHEIKTILNRFLFPYGTWNKPCRNLSGGEKMKLALCSLMVGTNTPDIMILDEPTNNIDIRNMEILTSVINDFKGTLLVVSHDRYFMQQIGIMRSIRLFPS